MSAEIKWQIIEDSGGNVYLAVFDNGQCIYLSTFEHNLAELRRCVMELLDGAGVEGWASNIPPELWQQTYNELTAYNRGWKVVMNEDGLCAIPAWTAVLDAFMVHCPCCDGYMHYSFVKDNKTHIYVCDQCPAVLFTYVGQGNVDDVQKHVNTKLYSSFLKW